MEITTNLSENARNDIILVEEAKKGSEKAYAKLMNRYKDSIYYLLLKMVNNSSDAEDLTIETFGKAFSNINMYTLDFAFSTWLFKIATNNCIDFIRKKQVSPAPAEQWQDDVNQLEVNIQSDIPDPEETLINQQKIIELRDVINQLKPHYKILIELRYYKEYSYEEIASELKLPIGTVKVQLYRAKILLANILRNKGSI
jgi:RNA polymerase sigma-70 factor (ECF subfamily)